MARNAMMMVDVFASDWSKKAFLKHLGEACEKTGWKVHGYVVMRNHHHLACPTAIGRCGYRYVDYDHPS
jgi:hypothetical protein